MAWHHHTSEEAHLGARLSACRTPEWSSRTLPPDPVAFRQTPETGQSGSAQAPRRRCSRAFRPSLGTTVSQNPHSSAPAIPRVRSSTTFVRLAAPETLQDVRRSALKRNLRGADAALFPARDPGCLLRFEGEHCCHAVICVSAKKLREVEHGRIAYFDIDALLGRMPKAKRTLAIQVLSIRQI